MICLIFNAICRKLKDSDYKVTLHTQAEMILVKYCQENAISDDWKTLKTTGRVSTSSKLASLNTHIDSNRLLRVLGRLENANLPPERIALIIFPSNDHVTHLNIDNPHRKNGYIGLNYGILKFQERSLVLRCFIEVIMILGRCMFYRILHQLMIQQMVSTAFLRLTASNGTPHLVYSENRTDLTDAGNEQREMIDGLDNDRINDKLKTIGWKFIPPDASHMAGVWGIGSSPPRI